MEATHDQRPHDREFRLNVTDFGRGEKLFIDYSGQTVPIIDAVTGELRAAQIFVAVLRERLR